MTGPPQPNLSMLLGGGEVLGEKGARENEKGSGS